MTPKIGRKGALPDLHAAARDGDLLAVQTICVSNPLAVNSRDRHSRTPLHLAAWSGQTEVVRYLCNNKADVRAAAMDDTGAIHFASQKGHLEIVRILVSSGVSVKSANRKGLTPLHYAVQGSHLELIKYLLKKGASLTATNKAGQTPHDLATTDETRSLLVEHEKSPAKEAASTGNENANEAATKSSEEEKKGEDTGNTIDEVDKQLNNSGEKRKAEETADNTSASKKAKVPLAHLLTEDDNVLDDEE